MAMSAIGSHLRVADAIGGLRIAHNKIQHGCARCRKQRHVHDLERLHELDRAAEVWPKLRGVVHTGSREPRGQRDEKSRAQAVPGNVHQKRRHTDGRECD
jgi:hypothetical protein